MKVRCAGYQRVEKEANDKEMNYTFYITDEKTLSVSKEVRYADELVYKLQETRWKGIPNKITIGVYEETKVEYVIAKKRIESTERKWCTYSHEIKDGELAKKKLSREETEDFLKEAYEVLVE